MAKTTLIKASSRASVKVGESFYTVEYCEERAVEPKDNISEEREELWATVNTECDKQVEDILQAFKK